ncbi:MAG: APC family permease, partial [Actinobacteria bacterium]|nr:APC family permease [Actinomycetota bacterium]MCG2803561.1 APC family permease [Cellulomonas sp.]
MDAGAGRGSGGPSPDRLSIQDVARQQLRTLPLVAILFFSVSGGPYGLEEAIGSSGVGMALVLLLVVPLVFAVPCALMSAELGSALPVEGGYYYWVKLALGRFAAFVVGIWQWLNSFLDTALYPVVFVDYLAQWVPGLARGEHVAFSVAGGVFSFDAHWAAAVAFMVPLAVLNARGSRLVGEASTLLMVVVLAPFLVLSVLGLVRWLGSGGGTLVDSFTVSGQSPTTAFGAGLAVVIWNYIGWDAPSTVLGEVVRPQRTYARALAWALPLITVSYLLPVLASLASGLHAGSPQDWADGDFAQAALLLGGHPLMVAVTIGAVVAQVGL